ncbi:N-alpha-acetyltransferase 25, NatB auxiliary subunit-like [Actinia tenebrosa]|uniref:N-alpha-acetyltransferase 25, NatB auxiliary subunit-like n=1 Tax=Actinia tenebrosa TaxID=6105 RepID=A0A6P8IV51_ACTTE|nr:N-alpha-acetyltransferase 25, NatB auxiliary subunit-like [Actinia tenebrosa]
MKLHKDGLELGKDLEPTVPQHSDGFALLAAHLLLDVNQEKGTNEMVWHLFILLESALKASPSNHHIKMLLLRIYSLMGGCGPSMSLFDRMEIKHIQLDTLGYLATRYLYFQGHFEAALSLYTTTLKYFFGNQKDTPEYFIAAYKYGSFEKIPEFESFRTRLNLSVHFSTVTYEKLMMETLQRTKSLADAQSYFEESKMIEKCSATKEWTTDLRDNRDLHIFATCDPPYKSLTKEQEVHSFEQEVFWIRLRCLILRGLAQAVSLVQRPMLNNVKSEEPVPITSSLEETIAALEQLLADIDKHPGLQEMLPFLSPPPSHLHTTRKGKHGNVVLESLRMCQLSSLLQQGSSESQEDHCKKIIAIIHFITYTIQDDLKLCISSLTVENGEKQMFNGHALEPLVHLVESFSHLVLLTSVSCSLLHKVITTKKSKKKGPASHVVELREACKKYIELLKSSSAELHSTLENIQLTELSKDLLELSLTEVDKETNSSVATEIWEKLQTSYTQSIKEIKELLNTKMNFAKTLHL